MAQEAPMNLGDFITKRREELGFRKIEFSKIMGVGADSLRSWEKGRFKPAGKNARNIVHFLKFSKKEIEHYFGGMFYG